MRLRWRARRSPGEDGGVPGGRAVPAELLAVDWAGPAPDPAADGHTGDADAVDTCEALSGCGIAMGYPPLQLGAR